ncbi:hypothetical protein EYZ11_003719 [Aspergillus tanneri]|uniref:Uncharacterized protein n=1 Tax=Aspergillus tanneri TaxID=1220188 RepID=A0A4V3UPX2_9EURO|nr:hypothetical protein EYZ11_003719 [Aspergillus tanneri]
MNPSNYASGLFDYYSSYPDDQPSGSYSPVGPSASTSHGRKRRRLSHSDFGAVSVPSELDPGDDGENELYASIDLTTVDESSSLSRTLAKQREDAIRAQHTVDDERGRSVLTAYKCPVCMDTPVDATSTACVKSNAQIAPGKPLEAPVLFVESPLHEVMFRAREETSYHCN